MPTRIFPDLLIQLDETRLEADFCYMARTRQIDSINTFDGSRPGSDDAYTVRQRNGLLKVVSDEDNGGRDGGPHLKQFVFHHGARLHVQGAEWLIHQQYLRLVDKGLCQRHALAHSSRKLVGVAVFESSQSDTRDPIARALECLGFWLAAKQRTRGDITQHVLPGEDGIGLEDIANARVNALHGFAHHLHFTGAWPLQTGDEAQGGGFAAAGRADHRAELARRDAEGEVPYGGVGLSGGRAEAFADVPQFDGGRGRVRHVL